MKTKRMTALLLAAALAVSSMSMMVLATDDPVYPVGGVEDSAYEVDDDGYVDLSNPTDTVPYGGTVYFPLLNENYFGGGSTYLAAQSAFNTANTALTTSINTYLGALTVSGMMSPEYDTLSDFGSSGAYVFNATTFNNTFTDKKSAANTALSDANTALTNANTALTNANTALSNANTALSNANTALTNAQDDLDDAQDDVLTSHTPNYADISEAKTREGVLEAAQIALHNAVYATGVDGSLDGSSDYLIDSGSNAAKLITYADALDTAGASGTAMMDQIGLYDAAKDIDNTNYATMAAAIKSAKDTFDGSVKDETAANAYVDAVKAQLGLTDETVAVDPSPGTEWSVTLSDDAQDLLAYQITFVPLIVSDLLTAYDAVSGITGYSAKASAIVAAQANYGSSESAELGTLSPLLTAYDNALSARNDAQDDVDDAQDDVDDAQDDVTTAEGNVTTATTARDDAQALKNAYDSATLATAVADVVAKKGTYDDKKTALDAITPSSDPYPYVYESDSKAASARIKETWELGKALVAGVEIVKKKATGTSDETHYNIGSASSTMRYLYFVAVTIKDKTTTSEADLDGVINLKKTGTPSYEFDLDISMTIGYPSASEQDLIPIDPELFDEDDGFYGDEEEQFDFECDEDSYFIVNTLSQNKIVLAADTDYDSDIADDYPKANLDFFNGNGANFNKIGELYLSADEDTYLYYVDSNGNLKELSKSQYEYDDYEEAYVIKTRTLGRYVVSDIKLKLIETSAPTDGGTTVTPVDNGTSNPYSNPPTGAAL